MVIVAAAATWRLLQGPIELDRLIPYVEEALQRSGAGVGVAVAGVSIGIDRETHQLDLLAQNVRLSLPTGEKLANFPRMATSFSLGAMLGGRIEPTRLVVEHPVLALTRDENGALSLRVGNPETTADEFGLGNALGLFAPLRPGTPWSQLRRVTIRDATIIVDDRMSGKIWRANRAAATLDRSEDGAAGDLSLTVSLGSNLPEFHATYRYSAATQRLDLTLAVDGLEPAALAPLSPAFAPFAQVQFPVSGSAGVDIDVAAGQVEGGRLDLGFGTGHIETDLLSSGRLPVARGELHANYAPETSELRLERLALDLYGGTALVVDGRFAGLRAQLASTDTPWPSLGGVLGVTVTHVPASRLNALWPRGVSPGGRKWVAANLPEGMLDELAVKLGVALDLAALSADFSNVRGTMRYHDLTVDYFSGLPPIKKVSGTATLSDRRLDFTVGGGVVKSLKATGGTVSITDIGPGVETLTVDLGLAGPLQDALDIIDAKPLRYAHDAGIDPARVGGKVETQLHFKLPLLADLRLDAVDYGAKATLSGASYTKVAFDRGLTEGNFALDLGHAGVHAQGSGKFDGSPATIDGNIYFRPKTGPRTRYRIGINLDDAARARLGWDFVADRLAGPVGVDLTYTVPNVGGKAEVDVALDLAGASLSCDEVGWKKPPQAPGSARLAVALADDAVVGVPQIDIKAAGLDARLAMILNRGDQRLERVDIRRLVLGESDVAGSVSRRPGGGWRADIRGSRLDIHRLLKRAMNDDGPDNPTPLAIEARIARVMFGGQREARDVTATLLRERGSWQSIKVDGRHADGRHLALAIGGPDGSRQLHFETDNLGASFHLFGIADNIVGGKIAVDGTLSETDGRRVVRAHVEGGDFSVVRAPALAQLLSFTSLDGAAGMMSGTGIPFSTLRGDISFSHGTITLHRMIGYGGALGISASGWLNPGQDKINLDGTLAPAYALNSVFANFPVLGSLLMGGEGQGLFAATFRLSGSNDDPTITVNPLSALTPGVLRHLFDPFMGVGAAPPAPVQRAGAPTAPAQSEPPRDAGR